MMNSPQKPNNGEVTICNKHQRSEKTKNLKAIFFCCHLKCANRFLLSCLRCRSELHKDHNISFLSLQDVQYVWANLHLAAQRKLLLGANQLAQLQGRLSRCAQLRRSIMVLEGKWRFQTRAIQQEQQALTTACGQGSEAFQQLFNALRDSQAFNKACLAVFQHVQYKPLKNQFQWASQIIKNLDKARKQVTGQSERSSDQLKNLLIKLLDVVIYKDEIHKGKKEETPSYIISMKQDIYDAKSIIQNYSQIVRNLIQQNAANGFPLDEKEVQIMQEMLENAQPIEEKVDPSATQTPSVSFSESQSSKRSDRHPQCLDQQKPHSQKDMMKKMQMLEWRESSLASQLLEKDISLQSKENQIQQLRMLIGQRDSYIAQCRNHIQKQFQAAEQVFGLKQQIQQLRRCATDKQQRFKYTQQQNTQQINQFRVQLEQARVQNQLLQKQLEEHQKLHHTLALTKKEQIEKLMLEHQTRINYIEAQYGNRIQAIQKEKYDIILEADKKMQQLQEQIKSNVFLAAKLQQQIIVSAKQHQTSISTWQSKLKQLQKDTKKACLQQMTLKKHNQSLQQALTEQKEKAYSLKNSLIKVSVQKEELTVNIKHLHQRINTLELTCQQTNHLRQKLNQMIQAKDQLIAQLTRSQQQSLLSLASSKQKINQLLCQHQNYQSLKENIRKGYRQYTKRDLQGSADTALDQLISMRQETALTHSKQINTLQHQINLIRIHNKQQLDQLQTELSSNKQRILILTKQLQQSRLMVEQGQHDLAQSNKTSNIQRQEQLKKLMIHLRELEQCRVKLDIFDKEQEKRRFKQQQLEQDNASLKQELEHALAKVKELRLQKLHLKQKITKDHTSKIETLMRKNQELFKILQQFESAYDKEVLAKRRAEDLATYTKQNTEQVAGLKQIIVEKNTQIKELVTQKTEGRLQREKDSKKSIKQQLNSKRDQPQRIQLIESKTDRQTDHEFRLLKQLCEKYEKKNQIIERKYNQLLINESNGNYKSQVYQLSRLNKQKDETIAQLRSSLTQSSGTSKKSLASAMPSNRTHEKRDSLFKHSKHQKTQTSKVREKQLSRRNNLSNCFDREFYDSHTQIQKTCGADVGTELTGLVKRMNKKGHTSSKNHHQ